MIEISKDTPIVILTGAGISQESGLATFRGEGGLWKGIRVEEVASPVAFENQPDVVHSFYNKRKEKLLAPSVQPNDAHFAIKRLQDEWPGGVTLVTQNVDDLHERGGSTDIIHMHGELLKGRCTNCADVFPWEGDMDVHSECPKCHSTGTVRVHVVWFGEMPLMMPEIEDALLKCGLFISIGTSGNVYPAAGFVQVVIQNPASQTVELNLEPSLNAHQFTHGIYGPATKIVPEFVDNLLSR
ncbi:NAD-dependent deacylase [Pseudemcibacter aquimaris]|uniref:NAD-dependent deacylase n=1 Tax=Pseudemcibacter aquimaris TaxID=2857064 RepID=UPI0020130B90|nr:NAD-dependent deacylase [Pseudemcibacter aquimaris]MCC3861503.1 NAD-dependent deacylase [Pseudemcibacter aquimaris]WDU58272.1 NAD-dependent deacylase [Pseudemcibacter aquimaris]